MATPVYALYLGRPTEAWYQLSKEEQDELGAKIMEVFESVGGKPVISCDSSWSSERWLFFGIHEFPSLEAVQENAKRTIGELNWLRYVDSMTVLGTKWE